MPPLQKATLAASEKRLSSQLTQVVRNISYKVGQVWHYKTRASEPKSTFTIIKIERSDMDTIFHIHIDEVKVQTDITGTKFSDVVGHAPFSKVALDSSVTSLDRTDTDLPEFQEGYFKWRGSFLAGQAGIFSIPVDKSVEYMEQGMLNGK